MTATPRPGIADRLSRMIRIPTVTTGGGEGPSEPFEEFVVLLRELYPLVHERLTLERITDLGLLYRWAGTRPEASPVVLMAHIDVVPVEETDAWTHPPFGGVIADGHVHGRGALDDKGPLIVAIEAVENLLAAGFRPPRDVYLSFGGNEETYGQAAATIAKTLAERGIVPWLVLDEGGAVVPAPLPGVVGTAAMIGVGEKGVVTLRLSARGEGGHASAPPPMTAVRRIARAVDRLGPGTFRPRTPPAITRLLRLFSHHARRPYALAYRVLGAWPWLSGRALALLGGEPAALVRTTIAPTMQSGGQAANVLPSQAHATLNLRVALGESTAGTLRRVRRRIRDAAVRIEVLEASEPSPASPTTGAAWEAILGALGVSHPDALAAPYVMMAATDARHFHRFAPAVYRFAPLTMSAAQRAAIHGVDESVEIAALERGEIFHRTLLEALA